MKTRVSDDVFEESYEANKFGYKIPPEQLKLTTVKKISYVFFDSLGSNCSEQLKM